MNWRKSTYSMGNGNCVEAASRRKSRRSAGNGTCVEAGHGPGVIGVRDTEDRDGTVLEFGTAAWREFTGRVKAAVGDERMRGMSDADRVDDPEILPVEDEREVLFQQLIDALGAGKYALRADLTVAEGWEAIAAMAVTGVLRRLRVMSGRQLAVLLATEANRHEGWVIREPPHYGA